MKKLVPMLFVALLSLGLASSTQAQCDVVAYEDCFGACGGDATFASLTIAEDSDYSLSLTNSLCGSLGVRVVITVNNRHIVRIVRHGDGPINFSANAGDTVTISAENWRTDTDIICVWQGEVNLTLCRNL